MTTLWEAISHFARLEASNLPRGNEGQRLVDTVLKTRLPCMMFDSYSKYGCYVAVTKNCEDRIHFRIYNKAPELHWMCHVDRDCDELWIDKGPYKMDKFRLTHPVLT